jgi:hypothetical protein
MKRILIVILLVISENSYAEWTPIGEILELFTYTDRTTIRRNGNFVKMWELRDYKAVQKSNFGSFLSAKVQQEYDCREEKSRLLAFTWFSEQMGNGTVVYSDNDPYKWSPIQPESMNEALWKIACGKK